MLEHPIIQTTLVKEVYKRIRLGIFQNYYSAGKQLDIQELAQTLGISRQPVKEAISLLEQEGLLEIRQRVGTFVRQYSITDVKNILDARLMIETFAVSHANLGTERLSLLQQEVTGMDEIKLTDPFDYLAFNEADMRFHKLLVQLADNQLLDNMYHKLNAHYVTARAFYSNALQTTITHYGQHHQIMKYLKKGEKEHAVTVLTNHILRAKEELLKTFTEIQ